MDDWGGDGWMIGWRGGDVWGGCLFEDGVCIVCKGFFWMDGFFFFFFF